MAQYLYVPFKRNEVPINYLTSIETWKRTNNFNAICYAGEKTLKNLPHNAKICILVPGMPGIRSHISGIETVPTEQLRHHPNLSRHLRITDGKRVIIGPETVDHMIEDGLLDNFKGHLQIQLFFLNAPNIHTLVKAFVNALTADNRHNNGTIRIDYYPAKRPKTDKQEKHTLYNKSAGAPKLSVQDAALVIKNYMKYKSTRCCGLSGLLGLNGLFSSDASSNMIKFLKTNQSETALFASAAHFLEKYPHNHLAKCLQPIVSESRKQHDLEWCNSSSSSMLTMN